MLDFHSYEKKDRCKASSDLFEQRKEFRRRIRLMYREEFLLAYVYISYHRFLILQIFAEVFGCGRIAEKINNKKTDTSAPAVRKICAWICRHIRFCWQKLPVWLLPSSKQKICPIEQILSRGIHIILLLYRILFLS